MVEQAFDPVRYLTKLSGKDYLEVKWRLVWFRTACPLGAIETECVYQDDKRAVFKAIVRAHTWQDGDTTVKDVPMMATGHGSETAGDFRDYLEKAETKAIGRALAALGFGTQFTDDHDFGAAQGRVVDAPVQRGPAPPAERHQASRQNAGVGGLAASGSDHVATPRQIGYVKGLAREREWSDEELNSYAFETYGVPTIDELSRRAASAMIEGFNAGTLEKSPQQKAVVAPRVDPQEANQQGYGVPEEPEWVRQAPGEDRYTA